MEQVGGKGVKGVHIIKLIISSYHIPALRYSTDESCSLIKTQLQFACGDMVHILDESHVVVLGTSKVLPCTFRLWNYLPH